MPSPHLSQSPTRLILFASTKNDFFFFFKSLRICLQVVSLILTIQSTAEVTAHNWGEREVQRIRDKKIKKASRTADDNTPQCTLNGTHQRDMTTEAKGTRKTNIRPLAEILSVDKANKAMF